MCRYKWSLSSDTWGAHGHWHSNMDWDSVKPTHTIFRLTQYQYVNRGKYHIINIVFNMLRGWPTLQSLINNQHVGEQVVFENISKLPPHPSEFLSNLISKWTITQVHCWRCLVVTFFYINIHGWLIFEGLQTVFQDIK